MKADELDTSAGPEPPERSPHPQGGQGQHAAIEAGPNGELVWRPLKAAWLTHHAISDAETHVKGGYSWDASNYLPVLTYNEGGEPILGFARHAPG